MLRQLHSAGQNARAKPLEIWESQLQGRIDADARKLQGVQHALLRSICARLSAPLPAISNELAPCAMGPACAFCSVQVWLTEKPSVCLQARIACLPWT